MQIGDFNIKPILVHLPDEEKWVKRFEAAKAHLEENGITDYYALAGVRAQKWGIKGTHPYLLDGKPEENHYVGDHNVGNFLTQYAAYIAMDAMDYPYYMYLEDDARFLDGWREMLEQALKDVPTDFDFLFVGSCCAFGKGAEHVKGNVWHFPYRGENYKGNYPMCTHCYIVRKGIVPHLIATNRDVANTTDASLMHFSFPTMKVYAVLPRINNQSNTNLLP